MTHKSIRFRFFYRKQQSIFLRKKYGRLFTTQASNSKQISMSLFAAYRTSVAAKSAVQQPDIGWLTNSSFTIDTNLVDNAISNKDKEKEKYRKDSEDDFVEPKSYVAETRLDQVHPRECYKINRKPDYGNLTVKTISWPAVSKYRVDRYFSSSSKKNDKNSKKKKRYFSKNVDEISDKNQDTLVNTFERRDESVIADYNRKLKEMPFDVQLWLEFVNYQDTIWRFEKAYCRGSNSKTSRIIAERKLSILDKAMVHNPTNEDLMRERVAVAERVYPSDELSAMMKQLVDKNNTNIIFWQGYIESKQCSMTHCNITTVFELYNQCLYQLHQSRRKNSVMCTENSDEEKILVILYQCGLFLRQSGLWEQLWTLLRLYLELNLSSQSEQTGLFKIDPVQTVDESYLLAIEETILNSHLPSHELWLRIEKLRESYHWLPCGRNCENGDPQRVVFSEHVVDLIHPITGNSNIFKLTIIILSLLKIPLLPYRDQQVQHLGLTNVPWAYDSIETMLSIFLPMYEHGNIRSDETDILQQSIKLSVGPQYLRTHPGQEEYLNFVLKTVKQCGMCFANNIKQQIALNVYWLRFERLLVILERFSSCTIHYRSTVKNNRKKILKNELKQFFKEDRNRTNFLYFAEMALIEYECGDFETAMRIFRSNLQYYFEKYRNWAIADISDGLDKDFICYLIRVFVEVLICENRIPEAISVLTILTHGSQHFANNGISVEVENEVLAKYDDVLNGLIDNDRVELVTYFLPDFFTEWGLCYGWFLYLTKSIYETGVVIEQILINESISDWKKEIFSEFYVFLLFKYCRSNPGCGLFMLLNDVLRRSLQLFPNNLFLLNSAFKIELKSFGFGEPVWRLNNILYESDHSLAAIFLIFLSKQRAKKMIEIQDSETNSRNRMLSLFQKLTNNNRSIKRCGLIWRLYLQYLYQNCSTDQQLRNTYYAAVETCPWLKVLYIDAAVYIPNELPKIQDLIVEKDLRLHLTPEELEVLRS